jgi:hypothetical protein
MEISPFADGGKKALAAACADLRRAFANLTVAIVIICPLNGSRRLLSARLRSS